MSALRSSFGLSPRVASSQRSGSGGGGYPRMAASPKIVPGFQPQASFAFPAPDAAAAQFAAQGQGSSSNGHWPPPQQQQQAAEAAHSGYGDSFTSSSHAHKRRTGGYDQNGNGSSSNGFVQYGSSSEDDGGSGTGQFHFAPYQPRQSPLRRDHEPDELSQWKAQQAAFDAQQRRTKRVKYVMAALLMAIGLALIYFLGQHTAPRDGQEPGVQVLNGANIPAAAASDELPPLEFGSDAENARRMLEELTAQEAAREKDELLDLEPSAVSHAIDPKDADAIAKLDPVSRATVVVPQPGLVMGGAPASAAAAAQEERSSEQANPSAPVGSAIHPRAIEDEDPDLLRRLAETQAMNQRELEKLADEASYLPRRARVVHDGQTLDADDPSVVMVEGGVTRVPAHPTPSQASHLVIEQLIHDGATDAEHVKPHSHKDHPSVPKVGRGIPTIPMPTDPKAGKAKTTAPTTVAAPTPVAPAATPTELASTPASPSAPAAAGSHGRKRDAKPSTDAVDLDAVAAAAVDSAPEPAGSSEDELLSELSQARRPADVGAETEEAATKHNKKSGLKGPVLRGANADAQAAGPDEDAAPATAAEGDSAAGGEGEDKPSKKSKKKAAAAAAADDDDDVKPLKGKSAVASLEFKEKQAAKKEWSKMRGVTLGDTVEFALPEEGSPALKKGGVLFGSDVQLVVLTTHKNQQLARKVKTLYSPLVKRMLFVSDARDNGLNATVLSNPHEDWPVKNGKEQPWRIYELFRALLRDRKRLGAKAAPNFYLVMKDTTFPLLDQIRWKIDKYTKAYKGFYPNFAGGRKSAQVATDSAFYKEQEEQVAKLYAEKKLMIAPSYLWGFDGEFLESLSDFTRAEACPLLGTESLALSGLVECAGGALDRTEYDMFLQTRSNHREKKLDKDAAPLSEWRTFDAFNGCNTPGMLQEAFDAYYGKLKKADEE